MYAADVCRLYSIRDLSLGSIIAGNSTSHAFSFETHFPGSVPNETGHDDLSRDPAYALTMT
jgi:hypothetical protein